MSIFLDAWAMFVFVYFITLAISFMLFTTTAWVSLRRYERARHYSPAQEAFASPLTPGISVILPAYNEETGVVASVRSLLAAHYPSFEIVVVNDGSNDGTLARLQEAFDLVPVRFTLRETLQSQQVHQVYVGRTQPELVVVDKVNGGKSDALNAGLRVARHPLFAAIDADAVLDSDAFIEVARPFLDDPEVTVASGGVVRVSNGCTVVGGRVVHVGFPQDVLVAIQYVEYVRAFLVGRIPWSSLNALMIVSGAFGLFKREAVEAVGGYRVDNIGEDVDLVMRLHRAEREAGNAYAIKFVPHPVCWTEAPADLGSLGRQRRRWQRGLGQTTWRCRDMILRPKFGWLGMGTLPYFILYEFLSPAIALVGVVATVMWWLLGGLSVQFFILFLIASFLLGGLLTASAVSMDQLGGRQRLSNRDLAKALGYALTSSFAYPQVMQAFQLVAYVDLARRSTSWGEQRRRGIGTKTPDP